MDTKQLVHLYRFFLQELPKGNAGCLRMALNTIRKQKVQPFFALLIRDQIHEKEAEIANLKNALNWLDSYSL